MILLIVLFFISVRGHWGYKEITKKLANLAQIGEKELQLCFEQIGRSICRLDVEKRILFFSKDSAKKLGLEETIQNIPESIKDSTMFISEEEYEKFRAVIQDIYNGSENGDCLMLIRYTDKTLHLERITYETIFNSDGKPARAVFTIKDVTEEYQARELAESAKSEARSVSEQLYRQMQIARQWQEVSETDALTGLFNRGGGEKRIRDFLQSNGVGLFCLLDIDRFKQINDMFGHGVGDVALKAMADCMRDSFRGNDVLIRFGGDEFAVLAKEIASSEVAKVCIDRFYEKLQNTNVPGLTGERLSASLGAVIIHEDHDYSFDDLYRAADSVMYKCKNEPNVRYNFYQQGSMPSV
ncbi:MAG: diguanylate cyclase [Clostridiales bacterium]|nr:diguanylate cyclase [Clostridiales bacterium]